LIAHAYIRILKYKEQPMKRSISVLFVLLALSLSLSAQAALSASSSIPTPDGTIGATEYQFTTDVSGMTIGATLGNDGKLYLSIRAQTSGWVALGVGGRKMDGSRLFLAYDTGKKKVFNEQRGAGHSHKDLADAVVEKWAVVKTDDGNTSLELVLPASAAIADGTIDLLYAYSGSTSYLFPHKARGSLSLTVSK
jgi:hypothetical protein